MLTFKRMKSQYKNGMTIKYALAPFEPNMNWIECNFVEIVNDRCRKLFVKDGVMYFGKFQTYYKYLKERKNERLS